jgi:hypothetical protein
LLFSISLFIVGCGGGGGEGDDNGYEEETVTQVSGEIEYFTIGYPPGLPLYIVSCAFFYADNGITYSILDYPNQYSLGNARFFTVDLTSFDIDELCGGGILAIIDEIHEKKCSDTDNPEDICPSPEIDTYCCPEGGGCVTEFTDCSTEVCGAFQKPCGLNCIDLDDTCCPENSIGNSCPSESPVCCPKDAGFEDCVLDIDECYYTPEPRVIVTRPEILSPITDYDPVTNLAFAKIKQNNEACGCPYDPVAGYGYCIFYDWTDSASSQLESYIAGYYLKKQSFTNTPELREDETIFVPSSEYMELHCNEVISNKLISMHYGWTWYVVAEDNFGNRSGQSQGAYYTFEKCRLDDGSKCKNP